MTSLLAKLGRERAVICGVLVAMLQALAADQITRESALPILAGIVLRFLVSPFHAGDDRDVPGPGGIAG